MSVFSRVSLFALGPLVSGACRAVGAGAVADGVSAVAKFLEDRLSDQSLRVAAALADASDRGWRTLELALAGESLATAADRAEDRAFREQVRLFLLAAQFDGRATADRDLVPTLLRELRDARAAGLFVGEAEAAQYGELTRFADPAGLVAAEWGVADELTADLRAEGFPNLAAFLTLRPAGAPHAAPLLAVAVRYHFRRAVEEDPKLFRGLAFAQLERLGKAQEDASARLAEQLSRIEERLGALTTPAGIGGQPGATGPTAPRAVIPAGQTNGPVAVSSDGTLAVCGSPFDGKLRVFEVARRKELRRLPGHADWVTGVAFSPDDRRVVSGGRDRAVKVWELATGRLLKAFAVGGVPAGVAFTPDGRAVAVTAADGTVRVYGCGAQSGR